MAELAALAALAGQTVVTAAVTDAWETWRRGVKRLLGRGDPQQEQIAERWLAETHNKLTGTTGADLERVQNALVERWTGRMEDLLTEAPGVAAELRALVEEIQVMLPAGQVSATDHSVAAGRDVNIKASGGSTAAGVIHGNVTPNPTGPGPENR